MICYKDNTLLLFKVGEDYCCDDFLVEVNTLFEPLFDINPIYDDVELNFFELGTKSDLPKFSTIITSKEFEKFKTSGEEVTLDVYLVYSDGDTNQFETILGGTFIEVDIDKVEPELYNGLLTAKKADIFRDTKLFQDHYGLRDENVYGFLDEEQMKVKVGHLQEELNEIMTAVKEKNLNEVCDGILDMIYVGAGLLSLMNMPVDALWNDIQLRNLNRKRRASKGDVGKRGSTFDVIKDSNWTPPRTADIIQAAKSEKE